MLVYSECKTEETVKLTALVFFIVTLELTKKSFSIKFFPRAMKQNRAKQSYLSKEPKKRK